MKKTLIALSLIFSFALIGTAQVQASSLSSGQISAIIGLLQSFGASASIIANVQASLTGTPVVDTSIPSTVTYNASCVNLVNDLSSGSTGNDVSALQSFLVNQGYLQSSPTGYFGPLTTTAVQGFQGSQGISNTGYVGPETRNRIKTMSCFAVTPVVTLAPTTSAIPTSCPFDFAPVCGVDGQTYNNACNAQQVGVSIASTGACGSHPSYSAPSAACATEATAPVCGTNNVTYANACSAGLNNIGVQYQGECAADLICKPQLECGTDGKTYDTGGCGTYPVPVSTTQIVYQGACNFIVQTPSITSVSGDYSGYNHLAIGGTLFDTTDVAYLDGNSASPISTSFISKTSLTVNSPASLTGSHTLQLFSKVTGTGNTYSFTVNPVPVITDLDGWFNYTSGSKYYRGGTLAHIHGSGFNQNSVVVITYVAGSSYNSTDSSGNTVRTDSTSTQQVTPTYISSSQLDFSFPTLPSSALNRFVTVQVMQSDNTNVSTTYSSSQVMYANS